MNKFTLMATALSALAMTAQAQSHWGRAQFQQLSQHLLQQHRAAKSLPQRAVRGTLSAETSLVKPLTEQEYAYTGTRWESQGSYAYTYDKQGNILVNLNSTPDMVIKQVYAYNEHGKEVEMVEWQGTTEQDLKKAKRQTKAYDSRLTDFVVERGSYEWKSIKWVLVSDGNTWKRQVNRDKVGNVTGIHVTTLYNGQYADHHKTAVTYNDRCLPGTWAYEEINQQGVMELWYTLKDMEWQQTDGQLVAASMTEFFTGHNKLKSARVEEPGIGESGRIEAAYTENGDYSYTFHYNAPKDNSEPAGREVFSFKQTDANGSYEITESYYADRDGNGIAADNELLEKTTVILKRDEHGNDVSEEVYDMTGQLIAGTRFTNTYANGCAYPVERVYETYLPDTRKYEPFMKIVASDFVDVTTAIDHAVVDAAQAPTAVYTLSGVKCGTQLESLPAGIYVVKQGNTVKKVLKK